MIKWGRRRVRCCEEVVAHGDRGRKVEGGDFTTFTTFYVGADAGASATLAFEARLFYGESSVTIPSKAGGMDKARGDPFDGPSERCAKIVQSNEPNLFEPIPFHKNMTIPRTDPSFPKRAAIYLV
jgi:hypothetical protein